jgi:tRNA 5-methylaminomethyl-2-thiouridine biosynthesis bifunctional protein
MHTTPSSSAVKEPVGTIAEPAIELARIEFDGRTARSPVYGDVYASSDGATEQAQHVFLQGNELPQRWAARSHFAILETGFGLGVNFLATIEAWLADPQRPALLHYVAVERHPPRLTDLRRVHAENAHSTLDELVDQWPPLSPGLHLLRLHGGAIRLTLAWGEATQLMRQIQGPFDAFFLDGFAPSCNPQMWGRPVLGQLARIASPGATAATWSAARVVRDGLRASGFVVERTPGFGAKRDMIQAHLPAERVSQPPVGRWSARQFGWSPSTARVAVLGAGLAGAACARALADRGWAVEVFEAANLPASGASGNPAGLIHATVHGEDGRHARLHRAAALLAARQGLAALRQGRVSGELDGLLSMDRFGGEEAGAKPWPYEDVAHRVTAQWASQWRGEWTPIDDRGKSSESLPTRLSSPSSRPGWFYPQGGWMSPADWVRHQLEHPQIRLHVGTGVSRLNRLPAPEATASPAKWLLSDAQGIPVMEADIVILALGHSLPEWLARQRIPYPDLRAWRGQLSWLRTPSSAKRPRALNGTGYSAPHPQGGLCFGATSHPDDLDPAVRASDHAFNLARLRDLTGWDLTAKASELEGRVGWRLQSRDKLPLIGAWPDLPTWTATGQRNQVRHLPRLAGLYVCGALGSRGLAWAPLAGEILASQIEGTPLPLENDLFESLDPGRFWVRKSRTELSRS